MICQVIIPETQFLCSLDDAEKYGAKQLKSIQGREIMPMKSAEQFVLNILR